MTKSFSKDFTKGIMDRTVMIANRLAVIDLTNEGSSSDDEEL